MLSVMSEYWRVFNVLIRDMPYFEELRYWIRMRNMQSYLRIQHMGWRDMITLSEMLIK